MKHAIKRLMFAALACMLSVSGIALGESVRRQPIEKVKIGVAAPLTGPQAHYGKDFRNGIILAVEDFNASQPIIHGRQIEIVLVSADDQADVRIATIAAQSLVDESIKGVLGHFNSGTTLATSRIYAQAGIPQIAMATAVEYTRQGFKSTFRMLTSDAQQGKVAGNYAVKKLGLKRLVIVDDRTTYGQGLADHFEKAAKVAGATIVGRTYMAHQAAGFMALLAKFKRLKPDAIFYGGTDAQAALLAKQMRELGLKATLLAGDMVRTPVFLEAAGDAAEGTVVSQGGVPVDLMPKGRKFSARYQKRFREKVQTYAPYAYDGAMAMFTAMRDANSTDPAKYLPALANIRMKGVATRYFSYDKHGNLSDATSSMYQVIDGQWQALSSVRR